MRPSASGNGGHDNLNSQSATQALVKKTYANAMSPKKEEAIIIDSIEGLTNDDYLDGLESVIAIENVRFVSKISGKRVCVFLNSKSVVEQLDGQKIKVKEHTLPIRPLIEKNKRVVLSNVYPMIPHELLIDLLKQSGITPVSQMQYIRAGLNKQGRSHVLSFRRQIYVKEEDISRIPENLQVNYDNTPYWVYLSTDSTNCFLCKQTDHVAKQCPEHIASQADNPNHMTIVENSAAQLDSSHSNDSLIQPLSNSNKLKRPSPSTVSSETSTDNQPNNSNTRIDYPEITKTNTENLSNIFKTPRRPTKLPRTDNNTTEANDSDDDLLTLQRVIEESPEINVLNYQQFNKFLTKSYGQTNTVEIALEYTNDIEGLVSMINKVSPSLSGKLKSRCYRLKKKL
ncbi:hypothetical protein TSAR_003915 [Trichomalopsis sarcophagae]|uniref:CCHC-type domain-containing protein n=1 Tax=Trichomalopsis sarcophagae TaxID=543379 RepID=A0A232EG68_9HYME|nr:hypothetical protein TSAR_003915 [Trichomalopsis sarcophagae]